MRKLLLLGIGLFAVGCAGGSRSHVRKGELEKTMDQEAVTKQYLEVIGIGAANAELTNNTQRRATSRTAAIVQAQYELASLINGIQLEGGVTVERAVETDSLLKTKVDAAIRGAEVVKSEWTNDDGCVVTLRLPKRRLQEMTGLKFK
jgi:hypothetical protein